MYYYESGVYSELISLMKANGFIEQAAEMDLYCSPSSQYQGWVEVTDPAGLKAFYQREFGELTDLLFGAYKPSFENFGYSCLKPDIF